MKMVFHFSLNSDTPWTSGEQRFLTTLVREDEDQFFKTKITRAPGSIPLTRCE